MNSENTSRKGYTWTELMEGSKRCADEIKNGNFPIEGTTEKDYMIIGDMVVYTPYIPLYSTELPKDK